MKYAFIFTLLLSIPLLSKEGFTTDSSVLTEKSKPWLARTFLVYSGSAKQIVGTAFHVHSDNDLDYFITAKHVISNCMPPRGTCNLKWGTAWDSDNREQDLQSDMTLNILKIGLFEPGAKTWSTQTTDLGLVVVSRSRDLPAVNVADLGKSLYGSFTQRTSFDQRHFVLGYPYLAARQSLDSERIVKLRISEGFLLYTSPAYKIGGFMISNTRLKRTLLYSDADSLGGNSGGPVINEDGKLLGVLMGGPNTKNYTTSQPFSYIVPIDNIKFMLGDYVLNKIKFVNY